MARQPPELAERQKVLGRYLAALRQAAGLGQTDIARAVPCHRTSVTHAEAGSQLPDAHFWETADRVVGAQGELIARYDTLIQAKQAHAAKQRARRRAKAHAAVRQMQTASTMTRQLFDTNEKTLGSRESTSSRADVEVDSTEPKNPAFLPEEDVSSMETMSTQRARSMEAILMDAADESARILTWAETANVGDLTIEQIQAEIRRIAHSYLKTPTLPLFDRTRELRDRIIGLLNGRQKPSHSRELYSAAGWTLTMLAWISTDLNAPGAAEEHLRAAWVFAENADQNNLRSWIRAAQHTAAFWQQDFARAAQYAEDGLRYAGSGSTELYLSSALALDLARCGDSERALAVLNNARNATERPPGISEDALTGPFTCSIGRAGGFWSDTYLALGDSKEALMHADAAVRVFELTPNDRRNFGSERMVRCQQVKAHLQIGEFDGASETLMPVLDTAPEHRVRPLLQRVDEISRMIASYEEDNLLTVTKMQDAIDEFQNVRACNSLPSW